MASDPQRVQAVFLKAAELAPGGRTTLLDRECGGDADLRHRVESLLAAHDRPDSFLDRPVGPDVHFPRTQVQQFDQPWADLPIGTRVGPYELLEKVGEGGMETVWVARQEWPVRRRVALKLIKPGMDSGQVLVRFEAERQALALMDHTNIARILDAGTDDRGRPYFAMELVNGVPVTAYCDELRLSVRERLGLFVPVCRAVQHAHQKGVIHRDIKPSNVLVCMQDGKPVPKVIDFGIAKAVGQRLAEESAATGFGAVVGTLQYMSPEQAELSALGIDTRTDVYSLGALLYELLTGTPPLDRTRLGGGLEETLRIIREEEPPKPSTRLSASKEVLAGLAARRRTEPAWLRREVHGELDWVVMKCLEKDRTRRYDTAEAVARDVERHLTDEPVEAGPPSAAYRIGKFARRNRGTVAAAAAVLAALLLGLAGTTAGLVWAVREREKARTAADDERAARAVAERRLSQVERGTDLLGSIFRDLDPRAAEKEGESLNAILGRRLDRAAEFDAETVGDPLTVARLRHALGSSYVGLGYPDKAVRLFTLALRTREGLLGRRHPDTLSSMNGLACAVSDAGRPAEAVALCEETLRLRQEVLGPQHPHTLATLISLAAAYRDAGRLTEAVPRCEEAVRLTTAVHGPAGADTIFATSSLASLYRDMGRLKEAMPLFEETLRRRRESLGPGHPETLRSVSKLAAAYLDTGRADEAVPMFEEILRLRQARLGPRHIETLGSMGELAVAYRKAGRPDDAVRLSEEALRLRRETLGSEHPHTLLSMNIVAATYWATGRRPATLPLFEEILRLTARTLGPAHPDTLRAMGNVASAYRVAGRPAKAVPLYEEALRRMTEALGPAHPDTLACTDSLVGAYLLTGRPEKALPLLNEYLAAKRAELGSDTPRLAAVLALAGLDLLDAGQHREAEKLLRECLAVRAKTEPDAWTTFDTEAMLARSLLGQRKYAEAEPLFLRGYAGLKRRASGIPTPGKARLAAAADGLVELYAALGRPDEAKIWWAERAQYPPERAPLPRAVE